MRTAAIVHAPSVIDQRLTPRRAIGNLREMPVPSLVFLLGPPGSGKTSLGGAACARLGLRFLDLPDDTLGDAEAIATAVTDADVVTLPWCLQSDVAFLRTARKLGTTIALWAHPETMQARARQPITFTARRGLVTRGGFGRHGTSCLEFRRLERACDFTLDLDGLSETDAVDEVADAIADVRAASDPAARLDARRKAIEEQIREDGGRRHRRAVTALADAMARFLLSREQAGASPRSLSALGSDLHVAAMLVFMYEPKDDERILDRFVDGAPCVYEFRRKLTDSPALVARYERNLRAFSDWLGRAEVGGADRDG